MKDFMKEQIARRVADAMAYEERCRADDILLRNTANRKFAELKFPFFRNQGVFAARPDLGQNIWTVDESHLGGLMDFERSGNPERGNLIFASRKAVEILIKYAPDALSLEEICLLAKKKDNPIEVNSGLTYCIFGVKRQINAFDFEKMQGEIVDKDKHSMCRTVFWPDGQFRKVQRILLKENIDGQEHLFCDATDFDAVWASSALCRAVWIERLTGIELQWPDRRSSGRFDKAMDEWLGI